MKKSFASVSLLPLAKKLGRSSYNVTMTHYEEEFKDLFAAGKNTPPSPLPIPPGLHGPEITQG